MAKVNKIQPLRRSALGCRSRMTLFVIGYYVLDIINQFK